MERENEIQWRGGGRKDEMKVKKERALGQEVRNASSFAHTTRLRRT